MWSHLHVRWGNPPHVTSPTWGPPPSCKQALIGRVEVISLRKDFVYRVRSSRISTVFKGFKNWEILREEKITLTFLFLLVFLTTSTTFLFYRNRNKLRFRTTRTVLDIKESERNKTFWTNEQNMLSWYSKENLRQEQMNSFVEEITILARVEVEAKSWL